MKLDTEERATCDSVQKVDQSSNCQYFFRRNVYFSSAESDCLPSENSAPKRNNSTHILVCQPLVRHGVTSQTDKAVGDF